ncbi:MULTISPECIES: STAS domain-containing protein [unclassified Paenibacillus]|uniref:STAS domain-containing protein n=1 Tax=unclassified Paenibacillus TaxID=185978 RepID=UPI001AE43A9D|nr:MULTISPECIES: STAS domain-containing protein [unclassified Paenibacillus]MBP1153908.1 anti-sigma B factor antagonist [Paenibacillus sp. PvP091]MBP1170707.1 anti-sigma B factor antagonist [Paenibacillus sp. PvR098]MBP2441735.1 anti-sigma B factor antagonist [Paenibacillus sp. PvP052]
MNRPQSFQVDIQKTEKANTVYLQGELDLSKVAELRTALDSFIADTNRRLVLNLKQLQYIDSTGIGVIVSVLKARNVLEAPFTVDDIPPKIQRLFDLTGITPFLHADEAGEASTGKTINDLKG